MGKKSSGSSARDARTGKSGRVTGKSRIDYSDVPPVSDRQLKSMRRLGRPLLGLTQRKMISVRLDSDVLERLKKEAAREKKPYQSLINEILARHVRRAG